MNSYGQFFSSATHQSIRLNNSLKRSATNLLQYLTIGILSQCFEKDIHHSANVSTKFFVIILFCKSQLYAENYTSGTKQSLDSRPVLQTVTLQSHYLYCTQNKNLSGSLFFQLFEKNLKKQTIIKAILCNFSMRLLKCF